MSLGAELSGFLQGAVATNKMLQDNNNNAVRNQYYHALISNQAQTQQTNKDRLALAQQTESDNVKLRKDELGLQQDQFAWRKSQGTGGGLLPPTAGAGTPMSPGSGSPMSANPAGNPTTTGAPVGGSGTSAVPSMTGFQPAPGAAYGYDQAIDSGGGTGAVPYSTFAGGGAVGDDDSNSGSAQSGDASDPTGYAGGSATTGGFSVQDVLRSWGVGGMDGAPSAAVPTGATPPSGAGSNSGPNPVAIGLQGMMDDYQLQPGAVDSGDTSTQQAGLKAIHKNVGAYTPQQVAQINNAVDPHGELDESARSIARLDAGVKFWLQQGDPQKASKLAQSLLLYGKMQSQKYGEAAVSALQSGDMGAACGYITRAYDTVPDGQKLTCSAAPGQDGTIQASITGPDGKTQNLGAFGPAQVLKLALGVKNGTEYMTRLTQVAQGNYGTGEPPQRSGGESPTLSSAATAIGSVWPAAPQGGDPAQAQADQTGKDIAAHVLSDPHNKLVPDEAAQAVRTFIQPALQDPKAGPWQSQPAQGGVMIRQGSNPSVFVPQAQFDQMLALRNAAKQQMAKGNAPGFMSRMASGVGNALGYTPTQADRDAAAQSGTRVTDAMAVIPGVGPVIAAGGRAATYLPSALQVGTAARAAKGVVAAAPGAIKRGAESVADEVKGLPAAAKKKLADEVAAARAGYGAAVQ